MSDDTPGPETPVVADLVTETALATSKGERAPIRIDERGVAFESAAEMFRLCTALVQGGVAPKGMRPGAVMASILKGRSLGLDEITAVTSIAVINGRTQMAGSLLLGLMRRVGIEYDIWHTGSSQGNDRTAHIRAWWPGKKDRAKARSFSMGDAARAKLLTKDTYQGYLDDMLLWRAVAKLCRQEFPEIGAGIYVHGEVPGDPETDVARANAEAENGGPLPQPGEPGAPAAPPPDPLIAELATKATPAPGPEPAAAPTVQAEPAVPAAEPRPEPAAPPAASEPPAADPTPAAAPAPAAVPPPADPAAAPPGADFNKPPSAQRDLPLAGPPRPRRRFEEK